MSKKKHILFAEIRPELLYTDREFEQLKKVLFAHVNAALTFFVEPQRAKQKIISHTYSCL